jgi:predicted RNA binding protein YcfA (HicA-like mRNA interferase family)
VLCMGNKIPLLKPREVRANLRALGFDHRKTVGSHEQWVREADGIRIRAKVTVDAGKDQFSKRLMKMMIRQSLLTQEEFCSGVMKVSNPAPKPATEGNKNA